jgi:GH25 family lysozyme M1 (1,4-beta-N-acetylmuramidase)
VIYGADVSHFQQFPNWPQVKASGRDFAVLKATEGVGYVDASFAANRKAAHAAGLIVGLYHFARAGDPAAEAAYFVRTVGTLQPGEFLVLDWEVPGANPPAWCRQWLDAVYAATGVRPLIYMNSTAMNASNWSTVAADTGLWLARYDGSTTQPSVSWWAAAAMKQYSSSGTVPGIAGPCDVDVFFGTTQQLLAYGKGGSNPGPGGFLMALTDQQQADIAYQVAQVYNAMFSGGPSMPGGLPLPQATAQAVWQSVVTRADASGKLQQIPAIQELADAKTAALAAADPAAIAAAIVGKLPAEQAAQVAALVLAGLNGAQLNVTQPAA